MNASITIRTITLIALVTWASVPAGAADGSIPLWQPTTITQSGVYVVTRDILATTGPIFDIQAPSVTIHGMGHMLQSNDVTQPAIRIANPAGGMQNVVVRDATIMGGRYGIHAPAGVEPCIRIAQLSLYGQAEAGVKLDAADTLEATGIIVIETRVGFDLAGAASGPGAPSPERPTARITHSEVQADVGVRCNGMNCQITDSSIASCGIAAHLANAPGSRFERNTTISPGAGVCFNPLPGPPGRQILLEASPGTVVSYNTVVGAMAPTGANHGIVADGASHGVNINENWVRGFGDDGIRVLGEDAMVMCNVVTGNGGRGVYLGGFNILAEENKVGGNGGIGLYFATSDQVYRDNVLRNNSAPTGGPGIADSIDGGGNIQ